MNPYILEKVKEAKNKGFNAIVIDCFGDPGVEAAREIVDIPVIGPGQSSMLLAIQIAEQFSIINILPETEPLIKRNVLKYGFEKFLTSIRTINIPVLDLEKDVEKTLNIVFNEVKKAIEFDKAKAIILGCTGLSIIANKLQEMLINENLNIPVIEPLRTAICNAIMMCMLGISHSKLTYPYPREKLRIM